MRCNEREEDDAALRGGGANIWYSEPSSRGGRGARRRPRCPRCATGMKVLATACGERVASATRGESTAVWRDAVRATSSGGRGDEEVAEDLRGVAEAAAARRDDRGGAALRLTAQRCRAISAAASRARLVRVMGAHRTRRARRWRAGRTGRAGRSNVAYVCSVCACVAHVCTSQLVRCLPSHLGQGVSLGRS